MKSSASPARAASPRLIAEPGVVPFVDLSLSSFSDVVSGARTLSETGSWVVRTPVGFVMHGYEQVRSVLRNQEWISVLAGASVLAERTNNQRVTDSADISTLISQSGDSDERMQFSPRPNVLSVEGADHQRLRRLVSPAFTPARADQLRPFISSHAKRLLDEILSGADGETGNRAGSQAGSQAGGASTASGELVSQLCRPYPIPIICELLGAPATDWQLFDRWADTILGVLDADTDAVMGRMGEIIAAQSELDEYIAELVAQRKNAPGDDLLSELIAAQDTDDDRLSGEELAAMVEALLLAGTDTTRNQLGATLAALADHPDQYSELRRNPELVPAAVEESLRYLAAVRTTARLATKDIELEGLIFPAGTTVALGLHAASLAAPEVVGELGPDDAGDFYKFDITAKRERPHLAFGSGIHHCLGAFLARAELQEALRYFVERVEAFELTETVGWKPLSMGIWGPTSVKVKLTPASDRDTSSNTSPATNPNVNSVASTKFSAGTVAKAPAEDLAKDSAKGSAQLGDSDSDYDTYLLEASELRAKIQASLPAQLKPALVPPLGRLFVTAALIGWAIFGGRVIDRLTLRGAKRLSQDEQRARTYARLRRAAEKLGPSYIKLAQLIAAGEGVFPDALVEQCRACRDQVTAEDWSSIRKVLEAELGPLHQRFASIETKPIAAASIAQAHAATLVDGTPVVVKVQRPRIRRRISKDIAVLAWVAPRLVGRIPIAALTNPPALVELFAETISEELDFRVEVANLIEVERSLRARPNDSSKGRWRFPRPHMDAVSERAIVMSRVAGRPLSTLGEDDLPAEVTAAIFRQMAESLLEGTCVHGIFHGDFHAGNVFVDDEGVIGLVDFGITGRLEGARRIAFLRYVVGLLTGDMAAQLEGMNQLGAFDSGVNTQQLTEELGLDRSEFDPLQLSEEEFVAELRALIGGLLEHGARIPKELMLFIKNFAYLTSVVGSLDPEMDILAQFERTASSFVARNGVRMAGEIGFAVSPDYVTEGALRQAMGVTSKEPKITWRLLRRRREVLAERISTAPSGSLSEPE